MPPDTDLADGYVSISEHGTLTVTVPATIIRVLSVFALLASAALLPVAVVAALDALTAVPLGVFGLAVLSAVALIGPFVVIVFAATLLE